MRTLKKLAAALFILVLTASSASAIVYGQAGYESEGYDESSAWEINSLSVLKTVRNDLNSGVISSLTTKYFRLTSDIDLTRETSWTAIGTDTNPFSGVFDGGGHTIRVLMGTSNQKYTGLFGYVDGGTIKNLRVKGKVVGSYSISATYSSYVSTTATAYNYAGGIAAYLNTGTIDNCQFDGEVKSTTSAYSQWYIGGAQSYAHAGGITAKNGGRIAITNCTVGGNDTETKITASETHSGNGTISGSSYASGIIGYFYDQTYRNSISYNYSRVTAEADNVRNRIYGYRDGVYWTVSGNTEVDPEAGSGTPQAIYRSSLADAYNGDTYSATLSATGDSLITWSLYCSSSYNIVIIISRFVHDRG